LASAAASDVAIFFILEPQSISDYKEGVSAAEDCDDPDQVAKKVCELHLFSSVKVLLRSVPRCSLLRC
jgi:hypothetical protein